MTKKVLVVKSSSRGTNSHSNNLVDALVSKFSDAEIVTRDVSKGLPLVDVNIMTGYYSPAETYSAEVAAAMVIPNEVVQEFLHADTYIIGVPMYNLSISAGLKSWIDLIVRSGLTFHRIAAGNYKGLLEGKGKKVYLMVSTGDTPVESEYDGASSYLKNTFGFMGVTDITVIGASGTNDPETGKSEFALAKSKVEALAV
jgi:FMN-dependent NADH-azoreductase